MNEKDKFTALLNNTEVLKALSDAGVFIRDLKSGTALVSGTWKVIYDDFITKIKTGDFAKLIHPDDIEEMSIKMEEIVQGKERENIASFRVLQKDGIYKWIRFNGKGASYDSKGKPAYIIGCEVDISELKNAECRLIKSIQREQNHNDELELLRQIAASISASLDIDETVQRILDEVRKIIPYQTASLQLKKGEYLEVIGTTGFKDNESLKNMRFSINSAGSLNARAVNDRAPVLSGDVEKDFPDFMQPAEYMTIRSWMGIPLVVRGEVLGLMALDHSEKDFFGHHEEQLARLVGDHIAIALENALFHEKAYRMGIEDSLTGVGNRHRLQLEGRLLFETAIRSESPVGAAILDIDHFKEVNDNFGHDVGDIILKRIAGLCQSELRVTDLLVRFGGEEFLIIFPRTGLDEAYTVCERIRNCIAEQEHSELDRKVTVSIGLF
ncbi:MAG: diguanylate cyclase, partial [Spirochaetales bacterium]|nr:diguanylate cyclase [Spirochaetales bacterium]